MMMKIYYEIFFRLSIITKQNTLKANAFRPPPNTNEISINRIKYTNVDFCRDLGIEAQNPEFKRSFFGLAEIKTEIIRRNGADVIGTPIESINPFHGDIIIGHKMVKGEQPPSEIAEMIRKLTKSAKLHIDPNPQSDKWEGTEIQ